MRLHQPHAISIDQCIKRDTVLVLQTVQNQKCIGTFKFVPIVKNGPVLFQMGLHFNSRIAKWKKKNFKWNFFKRAKISQDILNAFWSMFDRYEFLRKKNYLVILLYNRFFFKDFCIIKFSESVNSYCISTIIQYCRA